MENNLRNDLLESIIWTATRQGAFQRSNLYNEKTTDNEKEKFRKELRKYLKKIFFDRKFIPKGESSLYNKINSLIDLINLEHGEILLGKKMRFGNAQKFVNLYLKFMWIMGIADNEPPHFPVDSIVIKLLGMSSKNYKWTDMNEDQYKDVINDAKSKKGKMSLAQWEASEYLRMNGIKE